MKNQHSLYALSCAAAKRYVQSQATTEYGRALEDVQREYYRVGWMRGYKAGMRPGFMKKPGARRP